MLKALMEYSNPDFLTYNTAAVAPLWESGELAMAEMWGSSMGGLLDDEGSTPQVVNNTVPANAPTVGGDPIQLPLYGGMVFLLRKI